MLTDTQNRRQNDRPRMDLKAWYKGKNDFSFRRAAAINVSQDGVRIVMDCAPSENCFIILKNSRGDFANVEAKATWSQPLPGGQKFVAGLEFNNGNMRPSWLESTN